MNRFLLSLALLSTLNAPVFAHDTATSSQPAEQGTAASHVFAVGDLEVTGAFSRATLPNAPVGGGYLTVTSKGTADDRLLSATSPVSDDVQIHQMKMDGDVMKMSPVEGGVVIPAGGTVAFAPGGLHIMLT